MNEMRHAVVVDSFAALVERPHAHGKNAVGWLRPELAVHDVAFDRLARAIVAACAAELEAGVCNVDVDVLAAVVADDPGLADAVAVVRADLAALAALGKDPTLSCITSYPRDRRGAPIATDVVSFHVDRAPVPTETWLCTYAGAPSLLLDNDDAQRRIDDPGTRAALRAWAAAAGEDVDDEDAFAAFVTDGSFDLHYARVAGAEPLCLTRGALWKLAVLSPHAAVPPCIHAAPDVGVDDDPRLLLIC